MYPLDDLRPDRPKRKGDEPWPDYIRLACHFMEREAHNNPSQIDVARAANISQRTLETRFRQYLGVTPLLYLRALRLE